MKTTAIAGLIVALLSTTTSLRSQESAPMPPMPQPVKEHAWLQKFVGEWETEVEITMEPGKPAMKGTGTESARMLGGFWVVAEGSGQMEGMPGGMSSVLTLGYDPEKRKYVGTWIDSMTNILWQYEGSVDPTGRTLVLETEGPCLMKGPGATAHFKEVTEFKSADHRVFTSSMQEDDGKWTTLVTAHYRRKR